MSFRRRWRSLRASRDEKVWRSRHFVWIYCNPLKSHETTNTFFGKAWHWNHTSLEKLGKSLEAREAPRSTGGPIVRPCAAIACHDKMKPGRNIRSAPGFRDRIGLRYVSVRRSHLCRSENSAAPTFP